jgi:protein-L-isoaspartate(D-aspartate) O-methyltransferase
MNAARTRLVAELIERGTIRSDVVADAFAAVPRECFIPAVRAEQGLDGVYRDEAFVTKREQHGMPVSSSSQPTMMAQMLELLELRPGDRVLEVGAGTGYNAALISQIIGPRGELTTIDVDPELVRSARSALRRAGYRPRVVAGDGRAGWPQRAPYDRVIVTASADRIPRAWLDQLAAGGRIIVPLRLDPDGAAIQLIPVFERRADRLCSVGMTWGGFMSLHGGDGGWRGPVDSFEAHRSVAGSQTSFASLHGAGIARLSEPAARAVLAAVIARAGEQRAEGVTQMGNGATPLLLIYLLTRIPPGRRIAPVGECDHGVGLVDTASGSIALLTVPSPWGPGRSRRDDRVRWRLHAYSGGAAATEMEGLLAGWGELVDRCDGDQPRLRLTAYGRAEQLSVRFSWG